MEIKEQVQALSIEELAGMRPDLRIADVAPAQEALTSLAQAIESSELSETVKATARGLLSAQESDPVAELITRFVDSVRRAEVADEAKLELIGFAASAAQSLGVELAVEEATEESETPEGEAPAEEDEEPEAPEAETPETPEPPAKESEPPTVDAVQMVRAQRALDRVLRERELPEAVESEFRAEAEKAIDGGQLTADGVAPFIDERTAASKRAAESWRPRIEGIHAPGEDNSGSDNDPGRGLMKMAVGS